MKRLRIVIFLFSLGVFAVFAFNSVQEKMTSDYVPPVIQAEYDAIQSSVAVTDQELLTGMTASDNLDGDVTDSLVVPESTTSDEASAASASVCTFFNCSLSSLASSSSAARYRLRNLNLQ